MNRPLIIVGRTRPDRKNMASELVDHCGRHGINCRLTDGPPFGPEGSNPLPFPLDPASIVVFVSDAEHFPPVLAECQKHNLTLIVLSPDITVPATATVPVIMAPNLALLNLALLQVLPALAAMWKLCGAHQARMVEGRQASEDSMSVTAVQIADLFGVRSEDGEVVHVRGDTFGEMLLGISGRSIQMFEKLVLTLFASGCRIQITTEVIGWEPHCLGLDVLLTKIEELGPNLTPGVYQAHELLFPSFSEEYQEQIRTKPNQD